MKNSNKMLFDDFVGETKERFDFSVNKETLESFAMMTGDYSSLHMDEAFSRRMKYRDRIVHGMLPLCYISALRIFRVRNYVGSIVSIDAEFSQPIYLESNLRITAEIVKKRSSNRTLSLKITIMNIRSKIVATRASVAVKFEKGGNKLIDYPSAFVESDIGLLTKSIRENKYTFEEVREGLTKSVEFEISDEHFQHFLEMLQKGLKKKCERPEIRTSLQNVIKSILCASLVSTFIGMHIPGRNSTLIGFRIEYLKQIPQMKKLLLRGEVKRRSVGTKGISLGLSISDNLSKTEYAIGSATVIVNPCPKEMPSIIEMKQFTDYKLTDKVVLVTGASRGIGETTALLFALMGAKIIVNYYRGKEDAEKVVKQIMQNGGDAIALRADVANSDEVNEMVKAAYRKYGTIDVLVNNAVKDFLPYEFARLRWEDVQKEIDVTVKGAFNTCKAVIPLMIKGGGGSIINVSSMVTDNPQRKQLKYVIAKSAVVGLTRGLAVEYAENNIRVNMVVPNFVETDLVSNIPSAFQKKAANQTPMKRNASPVDVAQAIVFAASSFSSYTTGQRIMVTGGGLPLL
ncbi:SDR family oxidoreductase [candidate division KSB1 bacterium]|nr:SDR family oxidoreductase [candidate division KSB1 bacterium]